MRWLVRPWRDAALAAALVGASAAAPFLTASADLWQDAAADRIATTLVATSSPVDLGVSVTTDAVLSGGALEPIDRVSARIDGVDELGSAVATVSTYTGLVASDQATVTAPPVRLMARPGAVEALEVVESDPSVRDGVWLSDWLAAEAQVGPGGTIEFVADADPNVPGADVIGGLGPRAEFVVAGTYRALWDSEPDHYWDAVPDDLVPVFLGPFNEPGVELVVMDLDTLLGSDLPGAVRWDAPLDRSPETSDELRRLDDAYTALETDLVTGDSADAMQQLAAGRPARPDLASALPSIAEETGRQSAFLAQPIGTARAAGTTVGLGVMAAAGVLIVRRRRSEFVLVAGEGERWVRIGVRTAGQLLAPAAAGALLGVALASLASVTIGPADRLTVDPVDRADVVAATLAGLAVATATTAVIGQRSLEQGGRTRPPMAAASVAAVLATAFLWIQVARTEPGAALDLAVVALPLTALLAAATAGIGALRLTLDRFRTRIGGLPPVPFLAGRHLSGNDSGASIVTAALAVGIGMVAMSVHLVTTLDRTIEAKLATQIGGETRIDVFGPGTASVLPPDGSAFIRFQETRVTPGDTAIRVVAIDPATVGALAWPAEFGMDADAALAALETELPDGSVPVLAVEGGGLPTTGTFGTIEPIRYRVVGSMASVPLAAETVPTLLTTAARIDGFEIARIEAESGELPAGFLPPTARYRRHLVSPLPPAELADYLTANGLQARETVTRAGRLTDPDVLAPTMAFGYLRLLGFVAVAAAGAALLLHLSVRRRSRALGSVMMRRMGLAPGATSAATAVEVGILTTVAALAALAVTPSVAVQLAERFDPAPRVTPASIDAPLPGALIAGVLGGAVVVAVVVWLVEWRGSRRTGAEVLRHAR